MQTTRTSGVGCLSYLDRRFPKHGLVVNGGSPHFFMKIISTMNNENQNVEYKESWRDEYVKWLCGFANCLKIYRTK